MYDISRSWRCLVTGGAGFIGSHLAARLAAAGHDLVVVDDLSTGRADRLEGLSSLTFIEGDVGDPTVLAAAFARPVDVAFHLAARPSVPWSVTHPVTCHEVHVTATLRLLEACRAQRRAGHPVERVVLASSCAVYGDAGSGAVEEDRPPQPRSPYAAAKRMGELYLELYHRLHALPAVSLRFFNVYGPGQDPDNPYAAVVAAFLAAARAGREAVVHGSGRQSRDFVYVADVVQALVNAAWMPTARGVVNVGTGRATTILDLIDALSEVMGAPLRYRHGPPRAGDLDHSRADTRRAAQVLGWRAATPLAAGLRATLKGDAQGSRPGKSRPGGVSGTART